MDYETDSNFEFEIEKIIQSIELKDIRTIEEINELNNDVLDTIYKDFMMYDKNKKNLENAKKLLKDNYEYLESINELRVKDYVLGIRLADFYDLKLKKLGFYFRNENNYLRIGYFTSNIKCLYNFDNYVFFRKLNNLDKTKLFLIKTIDDK